MESNTANNPSITSSQSAGKSSAELLDEWKSLTNHKKRLAARKPRWVPSEQQLQILESCWRGNPYPTSLETTCIAENLLKNSVTSTQVHRWFKHRREYLSKKGQFVCRGAAERFTVEQLNLLEAEFARGPYPTVETREQLALRCSVPSERIRNWFNARRLTNMTASASKGSAISVENWLELELMAERRDNKHARRDSLSPSSIYENSAGSPTGSKGTVPSFSGQQDCMDDKSAAAILMGETERRRSIAADSKDLEATASTGKKRSLAPKSVPTTKRPRANSSSSAAKPLEGPVTGYSLPASVLNGRDANGFTPLLAAASNENVEEAEFLIRSGADVNVTEPKYKVTPLMMASATGNRKLASCILKSGRCTVDSVNEHGSNALHLATQYKHSEVVRLLLEAGANVDHLWDGVTCLHVATCRGDMPTVEALLNARADPNIGDKNGVTPLVSASSEGNTVAVRALLAAGAKINQDDNTGRTALMAAAGNGHVEALNTLLQAGASAVMTDKNGHDASHYAKSKGRNAVYEILQGQRTLANSSLDMFADLIGQAA